MITKAFIDTEFTDLIEMNLISIAIVTDTHEEFYAEVPFPHSACEVNVLHGRLLTWLKIVRPRDIDIEICFDYQTDWDLFADVLDDEIPEWCHPRLVSFGIDELLRYEFHKKNNLPEHHALYDAQANRYPFRERPPAMS